MNASSSSGTVYSLSGLSIVSKPCTQIWSPARAASSAAVSVMASVHAVLPCVPSGVTWNIVCAVAVRAANVSKMMSAIVPQMRRAGLYVLS